ncbi:FliH/SctL family protein [Bacillus carboniphilus]|uniref:Flagellar assembly protein FliH n=1 Tax=Bacillus carboniphilus TaxID=86663 RepID=A0ABN0WBL7_9BACI
MSRVFKAPFVANREGQLIGVKPFHTQVTEEVEPEKKQDPKVVAEEIVNAANKQAEQILAEVHQHREQMLLELDQERIHWAEEKEQLRTQVQKEAYEEGYNQGRNEGYKDLSTLFDKANSIVSQAQEDYHQHLIDSEKTIVELAVKVAEKVIGKKLRQEEDFISFSKEAIKQVKETKTAFIYVHPDNYEAILRSKNELTLLLPAESEIYVYANPELSSTSCLIETPGGKLDGSAEVQLAEIKQKLLEWLEEEEA